MLEKVTGIYPLFSSEITYFLFGCITIKKYLTIEQICAIKDG